MKTRAEHIEWCKERALAYLDHAPVDAFTSMMSDLTKHPETSNHAGIKLGSMLMLGGHLNDPAEIRKFIIGF